MRTHPDIGLAIGDLLQLARFWLCKRTRLDGKFSRKSNSIQPSVQTVPTILHIMLDIYNAVCYQKY